MKHIKSIAIILGVLVSVNIVWGAISDTTKTDLNFKVNQTKQFSTTDKQFYEEAGNKMFVTNWDNVFAEDIDTSTTTAESAGVVTCTTTMELSEDTGVTDERSHTADYDGSRVRHWIPPFFGSDYLIKIYEDDGSGDVGDQIAPADAVDWFWDYGEGRFTAQDSMTGKTQPLHVEGCYYAGDLLSDKTFGGSGGGGAWEEYVSNMLAPTNTAAGFHSWASSSVETSFRIDGSATTTKSFYITDDLKVLKESTFTDATSTNFYTTSLGINSEYFTDLSGDGLELSGTSLIFDCSDVETTGTLCSGEDIGFDCSEVEGTGINCSGESIELDATGDWTGTFDGQQGTFYEGSAWEASLANMLSPTNTSAGFHSYASSSVETAFRVDGDATTTGDFVIGKDGNTATTTFIIGNDDMDADGENSACLVIRDIDKGGYTFCTALDGSLNCGTDDCR